MLGALGVVEMKPGTAPQSAAFAMNAITANSKTNAVARLPSGSSSFVRARSRKTAAAMRDAIAIHATGIAAGGRRYHCGRANAHRHGAKLFMKLGIAYYAEQRLEGHHEPVERILDALDGHAAEHGETGIDHLRATHEVLGREFAGEHHPEAVAEKEAAEAK